MIKRVRISNYKSLADVSVDLDPVTVLIGRSGAGKSNFVEALRWLRDFLMSRNEQCDWSRVLCATTRGPMALAFDLVFDTPGIDREFSYTLRFEQQREQQPPQFAEERLCLGGNVLYHQQAGKWVQPPPLVNPPPPGSVVLGALTGVQEVTVAHLVLTDGIGCYAFPDSVLTPGNNLQIRGSGLGDNGGNFLQAVVAITVDLQTWQRLRDMAASLRGLKPTLKSIDLRLPDRGQVVVTHQVGDRLLVFDLSQESEGFRRLLACLLALYQTPSKQTLIFDEPEKGIYPAGLAILAEEFKSHADRGVGQVILTTHSPQFLDHFKPEQIRAVEMRDYTTHIGPVAPEQLDALREHFMKPSELLTVDEARLAGSLAEAG
jgi:predicted ATPase